MEIRTALLDVLGDIVPLCQMGEAAHDVWRLYPSAGLLVTVEHLKDGNLDALEGEILGRKYQGHLYVAYTLLELYANLPHDGIGLVLARAFRINEAPHPPAAPARTRLLFARSPSALVTHPLLSMP